MPITAITIENFKGIKEPVRIDLKPITLLFGPNSSGKSTIIHALHFAREVFERSNTNPDKTLQGGDTIDLGGFENLVHCHDLSLPITLRFDLDLDEEGLPTYLNGLLEENEWYDSGYQLITEKVKSAWVKISVSWSERVKQPLVRSYSLGINDEKLAEIETTEDGRQVHISTFNPFNPIFFDGKSEEECRAKADKAIRSVKDYYEQKTELDIETMGPMFLNLFDFFNSEVNNTAGIPGLMIPIPLEGKKTALPRWNKRLDIPEMAWRESLEYLPRDNFEHLLSMLIVGPGERVRDALRNFCYLGPLRIVPPRNFIPANTPDASRWANGMNAWDILYNADDSFISKVNRWMSGKDQLDSGYRVAVKEYIELDLGDPVTVSMMQGNLLDEETNIIRHLMNLKSQKRLVLWEEANDIEVQPLDIGVGISQVLPVIVASLQARSGFVVIEQPELHIHPALQVALGDLFIEQIQKNPDLIFILETHSEHMMLRFLRRIRETGEDALPPEAPSLTPDKLSIYFSEKAENGISLTPIRVDEDGDFIDRWPQGFFNERSGELF